jgi:ParB family chromosome partitioning protein
MTRQVMRVSLDQIEVVGRLRDVDDAEVKKIAVSFSEVGQITPVEVVSKNDGSYRLVAGAHRIAAAKQCGWAEIEAITFTDDLDDERLREIDENLARVELSPFDQANFLAERREIWERKYGVVKRGGDKRSKVPDDPLIEAVKRKGFFADTAERFGVNQKIIKRALTRRAHITPALWQALKATDAAKNAAMLDKVRKLNVDEQGVVLMTLQERGCTVGEAVRQVTKLPPRDPEELQFEALMAVWEKASPAVRKRFVAAKVTSVKPKTAKVKPTLTKAAKK